MCLGGAAYRCVLAALLDKEHKWWKQDTLKHKIVEILCPKGSPDLRMLRMKVGIGQGRAKFGA